MLNINILFRGTPSRIWLDHALYYVFEIRETLSPETSETIYNQIQHKLQQHEFLPRALFDRFQIETLTTTETPLDNLYVTIKIFENRVGKAISLPHSVQTRLSIRVLKILQIMWKN